MRTPRPVGGCHQCWTSPSTNWRAAARRRCSRASSRRGSDEGDDVLELVAEAVGAAGLVERGPRPEPAGERLVEQPAVEQDVHRAVRRPHLDGARDVVPVRRRPSRERRRRGPRPGSARMRSRGRPRLGGLAEQHDDLASARRRRARSSVCSARAGVDAGADRARAGGRRGRGRPAVRARRCGRGTRCGPRSTPSAAAEVEERDAAAELGVPRVAREQRPGARARAR